jgi:hypothetical protein
LEEALDILILEAAIYSLLFELFVSEVYFDFIIFNELMDARHKQLFPVIQSAYDDFRVNGNLIISSLANCTE